MFFLIFFVAHLVTDQSRFLTPEQTKDATFFHDAETGVELEVRDNTPLLEWLANNYRSFGTTLEFVTDRSQEGSQFCKGFGGIGGVLRWAVDFVALEEYDEQE